MRKTNILIALLIAVTLVFTGCSGSDDTFNQSVSTGDTVSLEDVPEFTGSPFAVVNENTPSFDDSDMTTESFEEYSELDSLGRCGAAFANVSRDTMPDEKRGSIGQVKPSGWKTARYDNVDGKYLYNRCHLIGYQLTAENANDRNLITGTRYMNVDGMLPFENMVADYVKETGNHVLYRVTPVFDGGNLVASGVQMEALSVEDNGDGVMFNVYVYNSQPGIDIDYATGESRQISDGKSEGEEGKSEAHDYVLNTSTKKYHKPECSSVKDTKKENRKDFRGTKEELEAMGYEPCGRCRP